MPIVQTALLVLASSLVAIADVLLRKMHGLGGLGKAFLSPWMAGAVLLYILQIIIFTYLFAAGAKLSYVGIVQLVMYAFIVLMASVLIFKETVSFVQGIGVALALAGLLLLNI